MDTTVHALCLQQHMMVAIYFSDLLKVWSEIILISFWKFRKKNIISFKILLALYTSGTDFPMKAVEF